MVPPHVGVQPDQPVDTSAPARKSRTGLWWGVGAGVVVLGLVAAAVLVIPRIIHSGRVVAYNDLIEQVNDVRAETHTLRYETRQFTVLYALQRTEAEVLVSDLEDLASLSDHYFTDADREEFAEIAAVLHTVVEEVTLSDEESLVVDEATRLIEADGYVWQTDFLNLNQDATEALLERTVSEPAVPVPDEDVTQARLEVTDAQLAIVLDLRAEAQQAHNAATLRASELIEAIEAVLLPLARGAEGAPTQAAVVHDMYPDADADVLEQLHRSAELAAESVTAPQFIYEDELVVPVSGAVPEDAVTFEASDAWRAVIITKQLQEYSEAITAAWITDAGGFEEALGFNPFLPFWF